MTNTLSGLHPDLQRHFRATLLWSVAVLVGVPVALWMSPTPIPRWFLMAGGAIAIGWGYYSLLVALRWYRWASRIVASTRPVKSDIVLDLYRDSDYSALYASEAAKPKEETKPRRFRVLTPPWEYPPLLDTRLAAKIYRDPQTGQPVAFELTPGWLWCQPGWRTPSTHAK